MHSTVKYSCNFVSPDHFFLVNFLVLVYLQRKIDGIVINFSK
jgi:hypothetical protein